MRFLFFLLSAFISSGLIAQNNDVCTEALPFCSTSTYSYPAMINSGPAQQGPNYGCLASPSNPSWFYFRMEQAGSVTLQITGSPAIDIDFICWGPFSTPAACSMLTADKIVDCSYSAASVEICEIPTTVQDAYYFLMITNFSNQAGTITFAQTAGTGITDCSLTQLASNNGPLCVGDTLRLTVGPPSDAVYQWTGPAGFNSSLQNPLLYNVTTLNAGMYYVDIASGTSITHDSTLVEVFSAPPPSVATNNGPVCAGGVLSLSAVPVANANYHWTGPGGFESSVQNPVVSNSATASMAGVYTLTTVNPLCNCASDPSYTTAVVNTTPAPTASSNGPVCAGDTLRLYAAGATGASFLWTGPNGFSSTLQNPVVSFQSTVGMSGVYAVTATLNGCQSQQTSVNVVVNPIPGIPVAGSNSPVCEGDELLLNTGSVPGGVFNWTGPNGFGSSLQNPVVAPAASVLSGGLYTVTVSVNGCLSLPGSVQVVVWESPDSPVAGNNGPVCEGSALNLTASTIENASYIWSGPNNFVSGDQNPEVSPTALPAQGGAYAVQSISTINGCYSEAASTVALVNPLPEKPIIMQNFNTLHSTYSNAYQWLLNGEAIAGAVFQDYNPVVVGSYAVNVTDGAGCSRRSDPLWFEFVGINNPQPGAGLKAYPNPTVGEVVLTFPDEVTTLLVVNALGQMVLKPTISFPGRTSFSLSVSGVYCMLAIAPGRSYSLILKVL